MSFRVMRVLGVIGLALCLGFASHAQQQRNIRRSVPEGRKWALLIGVDSYVAANKLQYAGRDMEALRQRLIAAGFPPEQVFLLSNTARDPAELPFKSNIDEQLDLLLGPLDESGEKLLKPGRILPGDLVIV